MTTAGPRLTPTEEGHLGRLLEILQDPGIEHWWGRYDDAKLREEVGDEAVTAFTIEVDGEIAGLITINEERDPGYEYAEPDLFLAGEHQGKGIGAEALRKALRWAFDERGHHRAIIYPAAENERAVRCYEKVGFKRIGIFRQADQRRDSLAMDMLEDELT